VLRFYRDRISGVPDELTTAVVHRKAPPLPMLPPELHGRPIVAVVCCYAGPVEDGERVVRPLRAFGTNGWNTSGGSAIALTRTAGGHSGDWAAQIANTGAGVSASCTLNDSPNWAGTTQAGTYHGSLWVRAPTPGAALRLRFREYQGSTLVGSQTATVTLTTTWQQVQLSYTAAAPGSSTLDFIAFTSNAPPGICFLADDATITRT
jgi:hypothetical protein